MSRDRVAHIFEKFATDFELSYDMFSQSRGAILGIPIDGIMMQVGYNFDASGDSYEFGTPLSYVDPMNYSTISAKVLGSEPVIGITERIVNGRLVILGGRDGLSLMTETQIQRCFMDDVARISEYYREHGDFI